LNFEKNQKL